MSVSIPKVMMMPTSKEEWIGFSNSGRFSICRPLAIIAMVTIAISKMMSVSIPKVMSIVTSKEEWIGFSNSGRFSISRPLAVVAMVTIAISVVSMVSMVSTTTTEEERISRDHSEECERKNNQKFHVVRPSF